MEQDPGNSAAVAEIFWQEINPPEHVVHLYQSEETFLDALECFVVGGLKTGDAVVAIATIPHLRELESRLREYAIDVDAARAAQRYVTIDVSRALSRFMVSGWPDEDLFRAFVADVIQRARGDGRRVRAFGQMVSLLWSEGRTGATLRLERLWNELCQSLQFTLLCAYPRNSFSDEADEVLQEICATHSKVIVA